MPTTIKVHPPGEFPRRFVPLDAELADWPTIQRLFDDLLTRSLNSARDLQKFLDDRTEFHACVIEEMTRRSIASHCDTADVEAEKRHLHMLREIKPRFRQPEKDLIQRYLDCPHRMALDQKEMFVFDRGNDAAVKIFREANVQPFARLDELLQQYLKLGGAFSVTHDGKSLTQPEVDRMLLSPDRALREEIWHLSAARKLEDRDAIDALTDEKLALRQQVARNAGHANYLDYNYAAQRFDYTPDHACAFHEAVQQCITPIVRKRQEERAATLGLASLRPWDLAVDPKNRPPPKPFSDADELARKSQTVFQKLDPQLGAQFQMLIDDGLLDLGARAGKAYMGYQTHLTELRLPFIFMVAAGTDDNVRTMMHEAGHAFHALASRNQRLWEYQFAADEFCEFAAMAMEWLTCDRRSLFYVDSADAARSLRLHIEKAMDTLVHIAAVDSLIHWLAVNPGHTREDRRVAWLKTMERFFGPLDWSGLENTRDRRWHDFHHLFDDRLYMIEYGIAMCGALQLWMRYRTDPAEALAAYKRALALGNSRTLPELFDAAGLKFEFSGQTLEPLAAELSKVLETLP
jgi:oligoendopeptidase F